MAREPRPKRILIVRYSVHDAIATVREGGRVQPKDGGGAEVMNERAECVGYLTKQDYARYCSASSSGAKK